MKTLSAFAASAVLCLGVSHSAQAATTALFYVPGTAYNTGGITTAAVTGFDMALMQVTACTFEDICNSADWMAATVGNTAGAATGEGWALSQSGDSFAAPFSFSSTSNYSRVSINGRAAGVAFDVVDGREQSPGSQDGFPFGLGTFDDGYVGRTFNVTYSDRLLVGGLDYGDLYTVMTIDWGSNVTGGFLFRADTDKVAAGQSITPFQPPAGVPEPGSLALVGLALATVGLIRRRKR